MKYALTALLTLGLAGVARADEVRLTNGRTLVGIAHETDGRVVVETRLGDIGLPKAEVESIVPGRTSIHEYQERLAALDACGGAAEIFALAEWAQEQGLVRYVNGLLQRTLEADPDHAGARKLLGFVRWEGRWIPSRERDAVMAVQDQHRTQAEAAKRTTAYVRRTTPKPERTPYWLGFPPMVPPRGSTRYDTGYVPYFPTTPYGSGALGTMAPAPAFAPYSR